MVSGMDDLDGEAMDYVDEVLEEIEVSGDDEGDAEEFVDGLMEVGAITEVGAARLGRMSGGRMRGALKKMLRSWKRKQRRIGQGNPSPPFGQSSRSTQRRAPLGFVEDGSGENFFTLAGVLGTTTEMRAKVSRAAHADRLLIVPSDPGAVLQSVKVGDEEQLLSSGAPVELYSVDALTDSVPDNFSPLGPALDFVVILKNTTANVITGSIGIKASVKR